jgi:phosphopantothenoylcysteine synthetase/decarboxylase
LTTLTLEPQPKLIQSIKTLARGRPPKLVGFKLTKGQRFEDLDLSKYEDVDVLVHNDLDEIDPLQDRHQGTLYERSEERGWRAYQSFKTPEELFQSILGEKL